MTHFHEDIVVLMLQSGTDSWVSFKQIYIHYKKENKLSVGKNGGLDLKLDIISLFL